MKNLLCFLAIAFSASLFSISSVIAQHEAPTRSEQVNQAFTAPTIDGIADEGIWGSKSNITELFAGSADDAADFSGYAKLCFDYDNLYLFVSITDQQETSYTGTGDNYSFDCVEFFQDLDTAITNGTGAYIGDEIQGRFNRSWDTYTGNAPRNGAEYTFAQTNSNIGWTVEAALPWVAFMPEGSVPEDIIAWMDKALGFDIALADNDGAGREGQLAWDADAVGAGATEDNAWHDTRVFGVISLQFPICGLDCDPIHSIYSNSKYEIYPNPASKTINFENLAGVNSVEIINLVGQKIKLVAVGAENVSIDVSDLTPGSYFARIYTSKEVINAKIIIR